MDRCVVVYSYREKKERSLADVCAQLDRAQAKPKLMILMSDYEDHAYYADQLKHKYPDATIIGTTTYVNFCSAGTGKTGLSVMSINSGIECSCGIIYQVNQHPNYYVGHVRNAISELSSTENTCCLEFTTAFCNAEELVLDTFQEAFGDNVIPVFGGSSGQPSYEPVTSIVSLNGDIYKNSCVFVFIHNLEGKIVFASENIYKPTDLIFKATDVDCDERIVYEYNDRPAAELMAETLKVDKKDLSQILSKHPMGRIAGDNIYITDFLHVNDDDSICYFSRIYNHTKMVLLEQDDVYKVWNETEAKLKAQIPDSSFAIAINCLSSSILFERSNDFGRFVKKLNAFGPYIGLSGCGEQLNTIHLNQTLVLAVFE